ncbi:MAG: hypothetical protein ACO1PB_18850 [Ramlibacter sp.]
MDHRLDPEQYARRIDAAERRAHDLRREAMAAFWPDVARFTARVAKAAWRGLQRAGAARHLQGG